MASTKSELRDGMRIDWDVPIKMDDGLVLRADVYRPEKEGRFPVILSYGPYAKGLAFQDGYPSAWQRMVAENPDVAYGSTNQYQNWEVVDPEKWVADGYVCVRVDSRGAGRSPGYIDHFSPRETRDFYNCIEWAGMQPWSNGKVGLSGISYYGINQWHVASLQPPHLAAMCIWEGAADWYRDMTHHGGILSTFWANWYDMQVKTVQYGLGERGPRSRVTGELVCGDETLADRELQRNRFVERHENEWPIARTRWTKFHLDPAGHALVSESPKIAASVSYDALGDGATFISAPLGSETEITGPLAARLFVSSSTRDADLFLVFRVFSPDMREVVFMGAIDPHTPVAQGWLRASHRKLDPKLSTEYRPYHTHDEPQPLAPGEVVQVDVEIWPPSIVVPAGHRVALTVRGKDYEWQKSTGARLSNFKNELRGCGPFLHDEPRDRPGAVFGGRVTIHAGPERESHVLVPVVPPKR